MAAAQCAAPTMRRKRTWTGTPEIYFAKAIDNSRLVKVEDPQRSREMKQFGVALSCLFLLVMTFAWQHFKAIEYGYKIEALRVQRDGLAERIGPCGWKKLRCATLSASTRWRGSWDCNPRRPARYCIWIRFHRTPNAGAGQREPGSAGLRPAR